MSCYGITRKSRGGTPDKKPLAFESGKTTVFIRSNFVAIDEPDADARAGFKGWEYDEIAYTHPMYTEVLRNENRDLKLAIAELAEGGV